MVLLEVVEESFILLHLTCYIGLGSYLSFYFFVTQRESEAELLFLV